MRKPKKHFNIEQNYTFQTIEEIFKSKLVYYDEETISFFQEMSKKVGITSIQFFTYTNLCKGIAWSPTHFPKQPKSNHISILVIIDGNKYLCEPYTDNICFFLSPLSLTLSNFFPMTGSEHFLDFPFDYQDFLKSNIYFGIDIELHLESHPFPKFTCETGLPDMYFSCLNVIESIHMELQYFNNTEWIEQNRFMFTGVDIVQSTIPSSPKRCRLISHVAFPEIGLFQVFMFVNSIKVFECFVDNNKVSDHIPFLSYNMPNLKFFPISPKSTLTKVEKEYFLVRFLISSKKSNFIINAKKVSRKNWKNEKILEGDIVSTGILIVPFDKERYEIISIITFPKNGLYKLDFLVCKGKLVSNDFFSMFFDVTGSFYRSKMSVCDFIPKERQIAPIFCKYAKIYPSESLIISKENKMSFIISARQNSKLEVIFREFETNKIIDQIQEDQDITQIEQLRYYKFTYPVPNLGIYKLYLYVDDNSPFIQTYDRREKELISETKEEIKLQNFLKKKTQETFNDIADIRKFYQFQSHSSQSLSSSNIFLLDQFLPSATSITRKFSRFDSSRVQSSRLSSSRNHSSRHHSSRNHSSRKIPLRNSSERNDPNPSNLDSAQLLTSTSSLKSLQFHGSVLVNPEISNSSITSISSKPPKPLNSVKSSQSQIPQNENPGNTKLITSLKYVSSSKSLPSNSGQSINSNPSNYKKSYKNLHQYDQTIFNQFKVAINESVTSLKSPSVQLAHTNFNYYENPETQRLMKPTERPFSPSSESNYSPISDSFFLQRETEPLTPYKRTYLYENSSKYLKSDRPRIKKVKKIKVNFSYFTKGRISQTHRSI